MCIRDRRKVPLRNIYGWLKIVESRDSSAHTGCNIALHLTRAAVEKLRTYGSQASSRYPFHR
eukprot:5872473-Pyramimonas_sp.AAC.1